MLKNERLLKQEKELFRMNSEIDMMTKSLLQEVAHLKEFNANVGESFEDSQDCHQTLISSKGDDKTVDDSKNSTDKNYDLSEYFKNIKMEMALASEISNLNNKDGTKSKEETLTNKLGSRLGKGSLSAKAPLCTLSTKNLEQQAFFPPEMLDGKSKSDTRIKSSKLDFNGIPESVKEIGQEGIVRFLSAKVKVLSDQAESMQKEEKKLLENIKELQIQKEKAIEEKDRLSQQVNSAKNALVKCEQNTQNLVIKLQSSHAENNHLKKELECLKKEIRLNKQNYHANELKLNRTLEELDKSKLTIQQIKQDEKDLKESSRRKIDDLTATIKKAEKQRIELLNGFKKQLILIDNLKKQNGLIEAAKILKTVESDFVNFLDSYP